MNHRWVFKSIFSWMNVGIIFVLSFFVPHFTEAVQSRNPPVRIYLDAATQQKGFTIESHDHLVALGVPAGSLPARDRIRVALKRVNPSDLKEPLPTQMFSRVYSFDVYHEDTVWPTQPLWLRIRYLEEQLAVPLTLAYWDDTKGNWQVIPSRQDPATQTVSGAVTFPYAEIALIELPSSSLPVQESGLASWYDYPYAAHRTLPFGTFVRVTNSHNGQSVVVEIRDRGPFIPGRVIDLPKSAFDQIASLGAGVIPVTLEILTP